MGSSTALPCAQVLVVPAGDKMLFGRETLCKSSHLWASVWGGKWSWVFSLHFDLARGSCPGWEAEPQIWCFLGRVPNVKKATIHFPCGAVSAMSVAVDILRRAEEEEEDEAGLE